MDDILKSGTNIKFMYKGRLLKGKIVGTIIKDTNGIEKTNKLHFQVSFDKDNQYGCVGLYNAIDLTKEIILCDDGYYLVQLFGEEYNRNNLFKKISDVKCIGMNVILESFYDTEQMRVFFKVKGKTYSESMRDSIKKVEEWCKTYTIDNITSFENAEKRMCNYKALIR